MPEVFSIRERAIRALVDTFKRQGRGVAGPNSPGKPYDFGWDDIVRFPITDREKRKNNVLAILEGPERKERETSCMRATLELNLEFHVKASGKEELATQLNRVLLNIQRRLREDLHLGGLTYNVVETGNTIDVDAFSDNVLEGVVFVLMEYKHFERDPREIVPGVVP